MVAAALAACGDTAVCGAPDDAERAAELLAKGRTYLGSGRVGPALNQFEQTVRRFPESPAAADAQWEIAGMYARNRELSAAFREYQKLVVGHRESGYHERAVAAQMGVLRALVERQRRRAAEGDEDAVDGSTVVSNLKAMLRQLIANGVGSEVAAEAQYALGEVLESSGSPKTAKATYEQFIERYPEHALADDAAFQIAYIDFKAARDGDIGRIDWADLQLRDFLARHPSSPKGPVAAHCRERLREIEAGRLLELADYYLARGKPRSALVHFDRLAEKHPDRIAADVELARRIEELRVAVAGAAADR